jgi:hypothetical protein
LQVVSWHGGIGDGCYSGGPIKESKQHSQFAAILNVLK